MRFLIRVDVDRMTVPPATATLTLSCAAAGDAWTRQRVVALASDGEGGLMPLPGSADVPAGAGPRVAALCQGDPAAFRAGLADFRARRAGSANDLGRYLGAVLLGATWWPAITAVARPAADTLVELALAWPSERALLPLERLPWELVALGPQPLVAGDKPRVAITRVVTPAAGMQAPAAPAPLDLPPRVLFVVGTTLRNPRIRAASEILNILRGVDLPDRALHASLIEEATPKKVAAAIEAHRPQVVHFICHGDVEDGEGWLEMESDPPAQGPAHYTAAQILAMLQPSGVEALPAIVVLGACRSASNDDRLPGTQPRLPAELASLPGEPVATASLGARLVAGGVPIVIGMSGRVADVAARLFTERFQASVMAGEPLISATAYARRAPFVTPVGGGASIDWAYPTVLLAETVDPGYTPTPALTVGQKDTLTSWIRSFALLPPGQPVFCQRGEFFDDFDLLLRGGKGVLVAHITPGDDDEGAHWGKTRLIEQLAFSALRHGHLPLVVPPHRKQPPRDMLKVLDLLWKQVDFNERQLELTPRALLLAQLADLERTRVSLPAGAADAVRAANTKTFVDDAKAAAAAAATSAQADADAAVDERRRARHLARVTAAAALAKALGPAGVSGRAACHALTVDLLAQLDSFEARLRALQAAALPTPPLWLRAPQIARPVVLLDNLDQYEDTFVTAIAELVNQGGLGTVDVPIPVVMTVMLDGGPSQAPLKTLAEGKKGWLASRPLAPFADADAMLAYQAVLLHPFNPHLFNYQNISSRVPFVPAATISPDVARTVEDYFRLVVKGWPNRLAKDSLYLAVKEGVSLAYFVTADDTDVLKQLGL
jgi:hypothetical protein